MTLSDREARCLIAWRGMQQGYCLNFRGVAARCDVEPDNIRRVVRSLARKGLLSFERGLFNDDGELAGSGYGLTAAGEERLAAVSDEAAV